MKKKRTLLFVHQSSELYGSDKTLFYLAKSVNENINFNVIVVIPDEGPLKRLLEENHIEVIISSVVKVSREMFSFWNIVSLPFNIVSSIIKLNKNLKGRKIDIIHSNTLAVLVGGFYSKVYGIRHIWHIHEIIERPKLVKVIYPIIVNFFSDYVVYNSQASKRFFSKGNKSLEKKSITILNGLDREKSASSDEEIKNIRSSLFKVEEDDIVIGLVGRINKWKGHSLLLGSFGELVGKYKNIKLVFVGSVAPKQEILIKNLKAIIEEKDLNKKCKIIPFQNDIWKIWDSIDIAVVPSIEPEPFGLVAVEAMLAEKPVIASSHGGVKEIVVHNKTGFLFEPNNSGELCIFLEKMITDKNKIAEFGINGKNRAEEKFSLNSYSKKFIELYSNI
ncbi:glycosyltransferase family 4 protein [Tamlana flava]|uniref:glycosyltransferase family 4 protein n=1 Tax=Tamlana flava TaxID=3158572 RepID=UPI00351B819A